MTILQEDIKDWIRYGYDRDASYMFVIKDELNANHWPYWVNKGDNVEVVRTMIEENGGKIVDELNIEIRLVFLNGIGSSNK